MPIGPIEAQQPPHARAWGAARGAAWRAGPGRSPVGPHLLFDARAAARTLASGCRETRVLPGPAGKPRVLRLRQLRRYARPR
ncbi:hypothetical protein HPB52_002936 [Rhipicephalus sanguineus]|uniref:Uncharacterized protein n=1 Tax=Rhipicephalus sanguineus TaxID=34632 RepID=A0A9D4QGP8_RHISA|nr:hypothetical protein HPB52_002936 [Rhipicephalus sanguineus]